LGRGLEPHPPKRKAPRDDGLAPDGITLENAAWVHGLGFRGCDDDTVLMMVLILMTAVPQMASLC